MATGAFAAGAGAQLDILQPPPDLPELADPPFLHHALFENPVPLVIAAVLVALLAHAVATRADRRRAGLMVSVGALLLGVVGFVVATVVQTDREAVEERTRETVAAVADADTGTLAAIFDPEVRLYYSGSRAGWDRGRILGFVETYLLPRQRYEVESHSISGIQTQLGPGRFTARSRARVSVTPVGDRAPTSVICLMTWRQDPEASGPDAWTLTEIQPLWVQGIGEIDGRVMPQGF
ncbi:MAG: hypothetical protein ACF8LK_10505 [Phycisphaerales bacterium JB041]